MFSLIPKETKFFDMFVKSAENLLRGAKLLKEIANNFDTLAEDAAKLERLEHDSDQITHEIMEKLNKTFVTPLDREIYTSLRRPSMTSWTSSRPLPSAWSCISSGRLRRR